MIFTVSFRTIGHSIANMLDANAVTMIVMEYIMRIVSWLGIFTKILSSITSYGTALFVFAINAVRYSVTHP